MNYVDRMAMMIVVGYIINQPIKVLAGDTF